VRILIADSQPKVRFALRALLEEQPELDLVGEATDSQDLLAQAESSQPDVLLVDWELKGAAPAQLLASLRAACPDAGLVVFSTRPESGRAAIEAGASAFVSKAAPPEMLILACRRVGASRNNGDIGQRKVGQTPKHGGEDDER
jgi:DNA-binding NarL/FixJ family response regulator